MSCQQQKYLLRQCLSFWQSSLGSIKTVERVKKLSRPSPHIHPLSASSGQRTNENVHSLNTAKQVTLRRDVSCYWVFCCFLPPSFDLLGASVKYRCLVKLSRPTLLSRQAKMVIFISKITKTIKSPILHQKRANLLSCGISEPFASIIYPGGFC